MMITNRVVADSRCNKVAGYHQGSLVNKLVKCMLSVGAGFTPNYRTGGIIHRISVTIGILSITFHIGLLQISRKAMQVLIVREYCFTLCTKKIGVPNTNQCHQYRNIFIKFFVPEMFINCISTF